MHINCVFGGRVCGRVGAIGTDRFSVQPPTKSEGGCDLIAEGCSTKQVAQTLHLSEHTVNRHRVRIMDRLGLRTVAELTKYAVREGLTPLD